MGKIVVSENVTLDGVIQDPAGDEGFRGGGWVGLIGNSPQLAKLALDEALAAGALLLGRRSYEWLAARWPSRSGELARLDCHAWLSVRRPERRLSVVSRRAGLIT